MPSGVQLQNARQQLFDAAERVLLRAGPDALTSRAITEEAGCAKGVLHRYFPDFDSFLAELVLDRMELLSGRTADLLGSVGTGSIADNLTSALVDLFGPVPVAIIPLITFRDGLRAQLRRARPAGGVAILAETADAVTAYLAAERDAGRLAGDADVDALAMSLVGGGHLLFSDRDRNRPGREQVEGFVAAVLHRVGVEGAGPGRE